jgi:hypothetical protein
LRLKLAHWCRQKFFKVFHLVMEDCKIRDMQIYDSNLLHNR